jgi:osmotically-inducible protein OsmY
MSLKSLLLGAGGGAALLYFLDPDHGARRRNAVQSQAQGITQKVSNLKEEGKPQPDDVTLAHKVESEIFRDADAPKGKVNVNAVDGVVTLRGEIESDDQIEQLEAATRKVQGVQEVENLLHMPGTPAPVSG